MFRDSSDEYDRDRRWRNCTDISHSSRHSISNEIQTFADITAKKSAILAAGYFCLLERAFIQKICLIIMSDLQKSKPARPTLWGFFKEVFNWYPSSYPAEERKYVTLCVFSRFCITDHSVRLLFKLDVSILVFACLCCKCTLSQ